MVKALLSHFADVNIKDYDGNSALLLAYYSGKTEIARMLIDGGADENVNAGNKVGYATWHDILLRRYTETELLKLRHGAKK